MSSLGALGALLEALGALFWLSWRPPGHSWCSLGALSGRSWGPLEALFDALNDPLGAIDQRRGGFLNSVPLLGPSWAPLGAVLGALGAVLEPSWASPWALLGHLGVILRPQEPIGRERARMQKTWKNKRDLKDFGLLGASLEGSKGTWLSLIHISEPTRPY